MTSTSSDRAQLVLADLLVEGLANDGHVGCSSASRPVARGSRLSPAGAGGAGAAVAGAAAERPGAAVAGCGGA